MSLRAFQDWLRDRGCGEGTVTLYTSHVKASLAAARPVDLLLERKRAPKTRRAILAALRAWARHREDDKLLKQLDEIRPRLPPARRKAPREPFDEASWVRLRKAIDASDEDRIIVVILQLMATRGFRVGDVLRFERSEVAAAVKSGTLAFEAKRGVRLVYSAKGYVKQLQELLDYPRWKQVVDLVSDSETEHQRWKAAVKRVERALKRVAAGVDIEQAYPHRFRRTVARRFLDRVGGDVRKLALWMGWMELKTAFDYVDTIEREELEKHAAGI